MIRFLLRNRLHLCATSAAALFAWHPLLAGPVSPVHYVVVPLLVLGVYQWNRVSDLAEDAINAPEAAARARARPRTIRCFALLCAAGSWLLAATSGAPGASLWVLAGFGAGVLYSDGIPGVGRLKRHPLSKNLVPSFVWGGAVTLFPIAHAGLELPPAAWFAAAYTGLVALRVEIAWDVRDARGDRAAGLETLATRLSQPKVWRVLHGVNAAAAACVVLAGSTAWVSPLWWLILFQPLGTAVWIHAGGRTPDLRRWSHRILAIDCAAALLLGAAVRLAAP